MKYSSTVDALSKENKNLRILAILQAAGSLLLACAVLLLHDKQPVQVERSSYGLEVVHPVALTRTKEDIDRAISLMVKARLDTNAVSPDVYLASRQLDLRREEQRELKSRGIEQAVIVRTVVVADSQATVEIDRVLKVGGRSDQRSKPDSRLRLRRRSSTS